jgi:nitroimidazol reductase NimA-like FMN-containing flavoprotein (pyridoxamine 5'-phosphate oxidase superfamily)
MSTPALTRDASQRQADVLARLRTGVDCWVASASADGEAYLIPLSFVWDGQRVTLATLRNSPTVRNLARAGRARLAFGPTRDVVILEGTVTVAGLAEVDPALAEAFARATEFDPRRLPAKPEYVYLSVTPQRILAWREANEIAGREIMTDGRWKA